MNNSLKVVKRLLSDLEMKQTEADRFFPIVNQEIAACKGADSIPAYDEKTFWLPELKWAIADLIAQRAASEGNFKIKGYLMRLRLRLKNITSIQEIDMDLYEWTYYPEWGHWE
jgi:hypothetical protein